MAGVQYTFTTQNTMLRLTETKSYSFNKGLEDWKNDVIHSSFMDKDLRLHVFGGEWILDASLKGFEIWWRYKLTGRDNMRGSGRFA